MPTWVNKEANKELDIDGVDLKTEKPTEEKKDKDKEKESEEKTEDKEKETEETKKEDEKLKEDDKDVKESDSGDDKKEETTETKKPSEESVKETVVDAKVESTEEKSELSKEMLTEIRDELKKSYLDIKDKNETVIKLQKEVKELKAFKTNIKEEKIQLSKRLQEYVTQEEEDNRLAYEQRLQLLSEDYKKIGKEKSVNDLKKLNPSTLDELENVVKIALQAQDEPIIIPSQSVGEEKVEEKKLELSKVTHKDFFKHVGEKLEIGKNKGERIINV